MRKLSFFNTLILGINLVSVLVLLLAIGISYVPIPLIPSFSILSLGIPLLVIVHGAFVLYWIVAGKLHFLLSTVVLVVWYFILGPLYKLPSPIESEKKSAESLSILSFNVREFNKHKWIDVPGIEREIVSLIQTKNPDVLCFQEFSNIKGVPFYEFPYQYQTPAYNGRTLQVILSKYPILNSGSLDFPDTFNNALYVDIAFKNDTIRLYNVHLQSFSISTKINTLTKEQSSKLLARFKAVMLKQYEQATLMRSNMEKSPYTKIVAGDFNTTQYSNVYKIIKGAMHDSFFEQGSGFGRTYELGSVPIRIDYILADPALEVLSHENFDQKLSDHYPVMATFRVKTVQEK